MKYFSVIALIGATQAVKVADPKLPEYRSEFYGDTWRYTHHPRLVDEDQWVSDAPQAYTVMQLHAQFDGTGDINYDRIHDDQEDSMSAKQSKYENNRKDNIDRETGRKDYGNVYPHPPELKD